MAGVAERMKDALLVLPEAGIAPTLGGRSSAPNKPRGVLLQVSLLSFFKL